jgi:hypothetical protein
VSAVLERALENPFQFPDIEQDLGRALLDIFCPVPFLQWHMTSSVGQTPLESRDDDVRELLKARLLKVSE